MPGDHASTNSGGLATRQVGSKDTTPLRPGRLQFQSVEIPIVTSRNPIMLNPRPGELADALRDSVHRQDAAPHPCPSCSRDASLTSVDAQTPSHHSSYATFEGGMGPTGGNGIRPG